MKKEKNTSMEVTTFDEHLEKRYGFLGTANLK